MFPLWHLSRAPWEIHPAGAFNRCRSSVVEHFIGNEEVDSSILSGSTIAKSAPRRAPGSAHWTAEPPLRHDDVLTTGRAVSQRGQGENVMQGLMSRLFAVLAAFVALVAPAQDAAAQEKKEIT